MKTRNYHKVSKISIKKTKNNTRTKNKINNFKFRNNKEKTINRTMSVRR